MKDTGSNATMPKHHWLHNVIMGAGVSAYDAKEHGARLTLWFNSGEPVWMAASSLKTLVAQRAVHARAERDSKNAVLGMAKGRGNSMNDHVHPLFAKLLEPLMPPERWECPYCGIAKPTADFSAGDFDGCKDCERGNDT